MRFVIVVGSWISTFNEPSRGVKGATCNPEQNELDMCDQSGPKCMCRAFGDVVL